MCGHLDMALGGFICLDRRTAMSGMGDYEASSRLLPGRGKPASAWARSQTSAGDHDGKREGIGRDLGTGA